MITHTTSTGFRQIPIVDLVPGKLYECKPGASFFLGKPSNSLLYTLVNDKETNTWGGIDHQTVTLLGCCYTMFLKQENSIVHFLAKEGYIWNCWAQKDLAKPEFVPTLWLREIDFNLVYVSKL